MIIPSYVTEIGNKAFEGCLLLTRIDIPSSVKVIGSLCFKDCSHSNFKLLFHISIPSSPNINNTIVKPQDEIEKV